MNDLQYISPQGLADLKVEVQERKTKTRREIADKIGQAKELGDLSENFEYHDAKQLQADNESRIIVIENLLRNVVVVEKKTGATCVAIGTGFTVSIGDAEKTFEIVGASEADPLSGKISNESPLGNKFLGSCIGDKVEMETPGGVMTYEVKAID
ncbi:transcription elongation factor GreA [Candidatus Uhrbacteria bacterium]|jgi:transcription elongation factor GreA|nr:transcription elongation factor GreA [Candidatus Uhrbacteria bacterium]